jgi:hypothetical protein
MAISNTIFTVAILSVFLCVLVSAQSGTGYATPTNGTSPSYTAPKPTSSTTAASGTSSSAPKTTSSTAAAAGQEATGVVTALVGAIMAVSLHNPTPRPPPIANTNLGHRCCILSNPSQTRGQTKNRCKLLFLGPAGAFAWAGDILPIIFLFVLQHVGNTAVVNES